MHADNALVRVLVGGEFEAVSVKKMTQPDLEAQTLGPHDAGFSAHPTRHFRTGSRRAVPLRLHGVCTITSCCTNVRTEIVERRPRSRCAVDSGGRMTDGEVYLHVMPRRRRAVCVVYQITEAASPPSSSGPSRPTTRRGIEPHATVTGCASMRRRGRR